MVTSIYVKHKDGHNYLYSNGNPSYNITFDSFEIRNDFEKISIPLSEIDEVKTYDFWTGKLQSLNI